MLRQASKAVLQSKALRAILSYAQKAPGGKRVLNGLSGRRGVFSSFEEGWTAARRTNLPGHEAPRAIPMYLELSKTLSSSDYAALFWLSMLAEHGVKVFDYGGNVGNLFYSYGKYLDRLGPVDWTVFDIPPVVEQGRKIARERNPVGLRFAESVAEFRGDQVLLASGFLHYWEGTIASFLGQFPVLPRHVIVNRCPVSETQPAFVVAQRAKPCAFPCIVRNAADMVADFSETGYRLVDRWMDPEHHVFLPLFPEKSIPHYSGFYFCHRLSAVEHCEAPRFPLFEAQGRRDGVLRTDAVRQE